MLFLSLQSQTGQIVMVVAPVLGILLLAAIVGMVIFTTMAKNKRATRGTYSPSRQVSRRPESRPAGLESDGAGDAGVGRRGDRQRGPVTRSQSLVGTFGCSRTKRVLVLETL